MEQINNREVWLDWMRVVACFLVMMTHCCEPFYFGGEGSQILTQTDAIWVAILNVIPRACVPLFVVASGFLLLPMRYSTEDFFRKRAVRVLVPFLFWTVVYSLVWGAPVENFKTLLLNFNYASGHLWFVYMLIGLYLIIPILSPWAAKVSKRELQIYLTIWLFTTLIPLIRQWAGGTVPVVFGPSGMPNMAKYPLWGECSWNAYGLFYYMSGFIGYLMLGLYFRRFVGELSWKRSLSIAIPFFVAGFALCSYGFLQNVYADAAGEFPVGGTVAVGALWEVPWLNDTIGVAMMTTSWILLLRKIKGQGKFYEKVLLPVSNASYGMYLCHMFILASVSAWFRTTFGVGTEGMLGIWTTPLQIIASVTVSFVLVALACVLIRKIPKVGKWVIG